MKTIRRLYFYAVAFIGVEVVLWGIIGLLRSIFKAQDVGSSSSNLAQSLALILVGLPIFLIHWLLAQKAAEKDTEEHTSTLRALFLYGILLSTLIASAQNLLAFINRSLLQLAQLSGGLAVAGGSQSWVDNLIAILANLAVAAYFTTVLRDDRRDLGELECFDEVRRLYRIVWVGYGLILIIFGTQQALTFILNLPSNVLGSIGRETVINAISLLLIGTPVWFVAWRSLQNALTEPAEKESYLRLGFLYLLSMLGLIVTMVSAGLVLYQLLLRVLGASAAFQKLIQDLSGPLAIGVPMAVLWRYYRQWLAYQIGLEPDLARRAGKQRLSIYLRALLGLIALIAGLLSLVSTLTNILLGGTYVSLSGLREPLAGALASMAIGLGVWLLAWREAQAQLAAEVEAGDDARGSLIRKVFLYLVIFGSVIGLMVSAGIMIFTLVNSGLGGVENNPLRTAVQNIANLAVFGLLLYYHYTTLRSDGASQAEARSAHQAGFRVLVLDGDSRAGPALQAVLARRQPGFTVDVFDINQPLPEPTADVVMVPAALALTLPEPVRHWLQAFSGDVLVVGSADSREIWVGDAAQAAEAANAIYEGHPQDARRSRARPGVWTYVAYVFAALFGAGLLFSLLLFGISMVAGGM